jgi:hypothetical protein
MPKEINVTDPKISYLTNFIKSRSTDQKKVLSRVLPYEGYNQNVKIYHNLFDSNNQHIHFAAVSPAADEVQQPSIVTEHTNRR